MRLLILLVGWYRAEGLSRMLDASVVTELGAAHGFGTKKFAGHEKWSNGHSGRR